MYKFAVRQLMKMCVRKLNAGDLSMFVRLAHEDFVMAFPGDNSWARMFRDVDKGRHQHATHRGIAEGIAFGERFVAEGIQFVIEDILVNGPPWNTRIALRVHDYQPGANGGPDRYNNRAIALLTVKWGKLLSWEDYEDTERVAAWDRSRATATTSATTCATTSA